MLWIPMVFMMAVTFTALGMTIYKLTKALFSVGLDLGNSLQLIFVSITAHPWCTCCNSGCEEAL